jgi:D-alanyl-D-alanine carboxypeptidase
MGYNGYADLGRSFLNSILAVALVTQGPMAMAAAANKAAAPANNSKTSAIANSKAIAEAIAKEKATANADQNVDANDGTDSTDGTDSKAGADTKSEAGPAPKKVDDTIKDKKVVNDVSAQLKRIAGTKAAFCFAVEDGAVTGYNENDPVRTASVTKTLTTFWAVERLGPDFQYTTKIYYQPSNHEMHIEGQRDPFFDRDRMYTLLADLNRKGVKKIDHLTFDSNFWFWPDATELRYLSHSLGGGARRSASAKGKAKGGAKKVATAPKAHAKHHAKSASNESQPVIADRSPASAKAKGKGKGKASAHKGKGARRAGGVTFKNFVEAESHTDRTLAGDPERIMTYLKISFNTAGWSGEMKSRYQRSRSMNPVLELPQSVSMEAPSIDTVTPSNNPLKGKPGVFVFVIKSAPIRTYLKIMNIWSINPYAEELFFSLGGKSELEAFMQKNYGFGARVSNINSGSGVNLHGDSRSDSTVSCSTVVRMIRQMDMDLESKWKLDLSDVMAVPGNDGGTWIDPTKTLVVKTGTLNHPTASKNLAGVEETKEGEVYFGIFVDRRGGNSGNVRRALSAMQKNFHGVPVQEKSYTFQPYWPCTHMALVSPSAPAVNIAKK